jgi:hypothetical protein
MMTKQGMMLLPNDIMIYSTESFTLDNPFSIGSGKE